MGGACSTYGKEEKSELYLNVEGMKARDLRRPRNTWKDSVKMELIEIECVDADWIHLAS